MKTQYSINQGLFELAVVEDELENVDKQLAEIDRLQSIGYGCSQTALDIAVDVVVRLCKCEALLKMIADPRAQQHIQNIDILISKMKNVIRHMKSED